ncbi:MAG: 16S rRNA (guanine(966)-N(2))-methyltransferase RsmD [Acidobacteria bacterium]|nr:16S rRNA (guanine(966)-N(2))-methyltransferase RsmD [Acidobacteriota bacterium]MBV9146868.1 16S rRNA (guanine(966)-N(2))-methyltransferase RsmD [Acidobacteriota bacterium]
MRIIAGQYRSRKLVAPSGNSTRPTSDRLRETLFNVVAPGIAETVWLDLFAGSGAVGIEALSRGARMVYFVESSARAAKVIRANLSSLSLRTGYELHEREVLPALRMLDASGVTVDFCFLDPPYSDHAAYEATLGFLSQSRLLKSSSNVIAEHDKHDDLKETYGGLRRTRRLQQGDAVLSFYRLE